MWTINHVTSLPVRNLDILFWYEEKAGEKTVPVFLFDSFSLITSIWSQYLLNLLTRVLRTRILQILWYHSRMHQSLHYVHWSSKGKYFTSITETRWLVLCFILFRFVNANFEYYIITTDPFHSLRWMYPLYIILIYILISHRQHRSVTNVSLMGPYFNDERCSERNM